MDRVYWKQRETERNPAKDERHLNEWEPWGKSVGSRGLSRRVGGRA